MNNLNLLNLRKCHRCLKNASIIVFLILECNILIFAQNKGAVERRQLFDNNWKFFLGDIPDAGSKDLDDKGWRNLDLPHDWSIEGEINHKNPTAGAGGYFPAGVGWSSEIAFGPQWII